MKKLNLKKEKVMKNLYRNIVAIAIGIILMIPATNVYAGNQDRSGQAAASELLINPWARSSGWGGINTASVRGLEATFVNVAGLAHTIGTQVQFNYTNYLQGSGIGIMAFGVAQQLGESGSALGISITNMSFGEIMITTVENPDEGGIGTFKPSYLTIGLSYSKAFSNSIYGGITVKIISESIADASASAVALDAGIQYITGDKENIKLGIALKNVGSNLKFSGDGLTDRITVDGQEDLFSMNFRTNGFDLPTTLQIGAGYDFIFERASYLSLAANFNSMAFGRDYFGLGIEGCFRDIIFLRAGYNYEGGIFDSYDNGNKTTINKGFSFGGTVKAPFNKEKSKYISIDYSYRAVELLKGIHTFGAVLNL